MTEVRPGLFVGGLAAARSPPPGVTHVVIAAAGLDRYHPALRYLELPLLDDSVDELLPYLPRAVAFMEAAPAVLVHCLAGSSRSVAVLVAYLMRKERRSLEDILGQKIKQNP